MTRVRTTRVVLCVLLAAASVALYWPSVGYDFVNIDDYGYVLENEHLKGGLSPGALDWIWGPLHDNWVPLTWLSFAIDYEIGGLDPSVYHRTNVLLHTAAVVLLFLALASLTASTWRSAAVAAVFAVHPLHVESVAWVAERKDVLSGVFLMACLWAYAGYARRPFSFLPYAGVGVLLSLGLLAKSALVTTPALLLLLDVWPLGRLRRETRRALIEKLPLFALAGFAAWMTYRAARDATGRTFLEDLPLAERIANALVSYATYVAKSVWPNDLAVLYPHPGYDVSWPLAAAAGIALLAASAGAVLSLRRRPAIAVGWFWFVGTLVPASGLVLVGFQAMADRFVYVPQIGLTIAIAWGVPDRWLARPAPRAGLALATVGALAALAFASHLQLPVWRDSVQLFEHTLAVTEDNAYIHQSLAAELQRMGDEEGAILQLEEAQRIEPGWPLPPLRHGRILVARGDHAGAKRQFHLALEAHPGWSTALLELANVQLAESQPGRAVALLRQILPGASREEQATAHALLGTAHALDGRLAAAARSYRQALEIEPDLGEVRARLALVLARQARPKAATDQLEAAEKLGFDTADAWFAVASIHHAAGRLAAGVAAGRRAVALAPESVPALNNLAWTLATGPDPSLRDPADAVRLARKAARLSRRQDPEVLDTLATALAAAGDRERATHVLDEAIALARREGAGTEALLDRRKQLRGGDAP